MVKPLILPKEVRRDGEAMEKGPSLTALQER